MALDRAHHDRMKTYSEDLRKKIVEANAGPQPDRRGLLEGQGVAAAGGGTHARGLARSDGEDAGHGGSPRRPRILRALRLPSTSPTPMKTAFGKKVYDEPSGYIAPDKSR